MKTSVDKESLRKWFEENYPNIKLVDGTKEEKTTMTKPRNKKGLISVHCKVCNGLMKRSKKNPKIYICSNHCGYYYHVDDD